MPFISENTESNFDKQYTIMGFAQGDGTLNKLDDPRNRNGIELNIGKKDMDMWEYLGKPGFYANERTVYHTETYQLMKELGFSSKPVFEREFPITFDGWNYTQQTSFIRGCYTANGSVLKNGSITYKTTCKQFVEKLQLVLQQLGISCYVTTNAGRQNEFSNGVYTMKESYDLNIQEYNSRLWFYSNIGFIQKYKMSKLRQSLIESSPKVVAVYDKGSCKVYDFTEPLTHWGVVEGVIAHNCGEITLANAEPCNLAEVIPYMCYKQGIDVYEALRIATQYTYRVTFAKYSWKAIQNVIEKNRRIGLS